MRRSFAWKSQARAAVAEDNLQREALTATIRVESTYGKGKHKNMKPKGDIGWFNFAAAVPQLTYREQYGLMCH